MTQSRPAPTGDYLTDVPYVRHFVHDLSPPSLRIAAALNGFAPPPGDDFDYCELGAGNGDTLATLAASYPRSRFIGIDINPEHVATGTALAEKGGLANVRFLQRDFEDLAAEEKPGTSFDYIVANGVLSWVSRDKQRALIELASKRLKPGGILYVSYNALPGWAAIEPLRALLVDTTRDVEGGSLERARLGIRFAELLANGNAGYFTDNPAAAKILKTMVAGGLSYVAHEYFHAHWRAQYFGEVAREMAASGLHFIAQLPLHRNYRDLTIPDALLPMFSQIENRILFESLKDFAVNEFFRRDVYVRGVVGRSDTQTRAFLDETPFGTFVGEEQMLREIPVAHRSLRFAGPVYDALIARVAKGATTVNELVRDPSLEPFGVDRVREGVRLLTLGGQVMPMARTVARPEPRPGKVVVPLAYNRAVLGQPLSEKATFIVAAPNAGAGLSLTLLDALFVRIVTTTTPEQRLPTLEKMLTASPVTIRAKGEVVTDAAERARIVTDELETFLRTRIPKLVDLGVLAFEAAT